MHKKIQFWNSRVQLVSKPPKSGWLFGKKFVELFRESFLGWNSSLEPFVFLFSSSLPYGLEESRELRDWVRWVLG